MELELPISKKSEVPDQDEIKVFLAKIRKELSPQLVELKIHIKHDSLQIQMESERNLDKNYCFHLIKNSLKDQKFRALKKIKVFAKEVSNLFPDWSIEFELSSTIDFTKQVWRCVATLTGHSKGVNSIAVNPDNQTIVSGSNDKLLKRWQLSTGEEIDTLIGHSGLMAGVYCVAISPDGKLIISGSDDKTIKLWDSSTNRQIRSLVGHDSGIRGIAITPDSKVLASVSTVQDQKIKLWELNTGQEIATISGGIMDVAISPNGGLLASSTAAHIVKIWELKSKSEIYQLEGHSDTVYSLAFSPDGKTLASGGSDAVIRLWDIGTGTLKLNLSGHTGWVNSTAFHPSGRILASGENIQGNQLKLWDLESGENIATLSGHSKGIRSLAFSPDGLSLVSAGDDKTIMIWRFS